MTAIASPPRESVSEELWTQLTRRIASDEGVPLSEAEGIMEEALEFLLRCAESEGGEHTPSERADIGWHTFILYTRAYHNWCLEHAGRFLHHSPRPLDEHLQLAGGDPICVNVCSCPPGKCCNFS